MKLSKLISVLLIGLFLVGGSYIGYRVGVSQQEKAPTFGLVGQINKIAELNVIEYSFNYVKKFEDSRQIANFNLPLTEKSVIVSIPGTIKYHVDLSKVKKNDIDVNADKTEASVTMPKLEVDAIIDVDNVERYDETNNLFNPIHLDDNDKFYTEALKAAQRQAEEKGIVDQGETNAEHIIQCAVKSLPGYEKCVVHCDFN